MSRAAETLPHRVLVERQLQDAVVRLSSELAALTARVAQLEGGATPPAPIVRGRGARRVLAAPPPA